MFDGSKMRNFDENSSSCRRYNAPANSMLPQTLMGVFATITTYATVTNSGGFIPSLDSDCTMMMKGLTALTWG